MDVFNELMREDIANVMHVTRRRDGSSDYTLRNDVVSELVAVAHEMRHSRLIGARQNYGQVPSEVVAEQSRRSRLWLN